MKVAGVEYSLLSREEVLKQCEGWLSDNGGHHIVTLNPEMVMEAQENTQFARAVERAALRVADGSGLLWATEYMNNGDRYPIWSLLRFGRRRSQRPVPGVDLLVDMAGVCKQRGETLFLLGASAASNTGACEALRAAVPGLQVRGFSGGQWDMEGPERVLENIRTERPAVLAVAYGVPAQTLWIDRHLATLPSVKIAVGVGGALDMLAGARPRAPLWWQDHHIEWLWRWRLEPKRWRRMVRATWRFVRLVQHEKRQNGH